MDSMTDARPDPAAGKEKPPRRVLLVSNPKARRGGESVDAVAGRLAAAGIDVRQEPFSTPAEAEADIVRLAPAVDAVIVGGGDGTMGLAARALLQVPKPLGILPLGTANDLARTLHIPEDLDAAADIVIAGHRRRIDLGTVNGQPFFNVASIGLSVELAKSLTHEEKKRWGRLGYARAALRVLTRARPFRAEIIESDDRIRTSTLQIAVGNGRFYGGGNVVEEDAAIDDGHLDLYSLELGNVWKLALMARTFRTGAFGAWSEVRQLRGTEFDIRTRHRQPVNADGEIVTETPAHFITHPGAITVFAPPKHMVQPV